MTISDYQLQAESLPLWFIWEKKKKKKTGWNRQTDGGRVVESPPTSDLSKHSYISSSGLWRPFPRSNLVHLGPVPVAQTGHQRGHVERWWPAGKQLRSLFIQGGFTEHTGVLFRNTLLHIQSAIVPTWEYVNTNSLWVIPLEEAGVKEHRESSFLYNYMIKDNYFIHAKRCTGQNSLDVLTTAVCLRVFLRFIFFPREFSVSTRPTVLWLLSWLCCRRATVSFSSQRRGFVSHMKPKVKSAGSYSDPIHKGLVAPVGLESFAVIAEEVCDFNLMWITYHEIMR